MSTESPTGDLPFQPDAWVIDTHNPAKRGQFTGKTQRAGSHVMVELRYPDGRRGTRPLNLLRAVSADEGSSIDDRLESGSFGKARDLRRLVTFEKLKGTLHEVVYSMEAAQIDFYPYQFKPVLKFIDSPTERLIIADEVGLGKTIESALIWMELQARRQAKRLLVVCPRILTDKWRDELRNKFLFEARIVDFKQLGEELQELKRIGPLHSFVLIASYSALRPPKRDFPLLNHPPDGETDVLTKTKLMRELRHWPLPFAPFDLVIFDEAHYMRNAGTATFHLGESLSAHENTGVLCVSATPVHNSNTDLHSLLRLIDRDFFETQGMFDELLTGNRPAIQAINALSQTPVDILGLQQGVLGMKDSPFIKDSPLFRHFLDLLAQLKEHPSDKALLARAQDTAEKLNLLGGYINRTRRIQVEEERPERRPVVLTVDYTPEEMALYNAILDLVRRQCVREEKAFHIFHSLSLQLRAASCLPVVAEEIKSGKFGSLRGAGDETDDLLTEAVGEGTYEIDDSLNEDNKPLNISLAELARFDFEANDTKFASLQHLLVDLVSNEKVVLFAFYRPTLEYLQRRLTSLGISVATIHGGVEHSQRWIELDRFRDPRGPRVLLSSEVGSEGIDLQFASVMVNYDLPWNPMRVEQRIGRIDRVGQTAKVLRIVNFKITGTVEERLYERLHSKLLLSTNTLGDLESIVGEEVQKLTTDLLSQELTPEAELARMDRAEQVIQQRMIQIQRLEESGDALVALSDYVQKKIRENRERGRYILPQELEDYIEDFFAREFPGTELNHNTPAEGCVRLRLSPDAHASLTEFIGNDHSLVSRPLRQREVSLTFRREALSLLPPHQRKGVHFANHLSPLIRWITRRNRDGIHSFYNVSALTLDSAQLPAGTYAYRLERWTLKGLTPRQTMEFGVICLDDNSLLGANESEEILQHLLRNGRDWNDVNADPQQLREAHLQLKDILAERFNSAVAQFEAENETSVLIRVRRAANHWDRLIQQSEKAIQTMIEGGRPQPMIRARKTRLENELRNKQERIAELRRSSQVEPEVEEVAAGIFKILPGSKSDNQP
jgi:SNF2 family DNA or RNA helicase